MNKTIRKLSILGVAALVSGCGLQPLAPPRAPIKPVTCANKAQCDYYWQRAQVWIARNSELKLQVATDTLLETYGSINEGTIVYSITREPIADGSARIEMSATCADIFGCRQNAWDQLGKFNAYVNGN